MKNDRYKHYKGTEYLVIGIALDTISQTKMVVYRALYPVPELEETYGINPLFTRPYESFFEQITHEGITQPRFTKIEE